jgi:hypothetical protein
MKLGLMEPPVCAPLVSLPAVAVAAADIIL